MATIDRPTKGVLDRRGKRRRKEQVGLEIHVVEDHDEALGPLLRAMGSRRLPLADNVLLHFDAHPDLLLPMDMPAADVFRKEALREQVSIASWILPLVFGGHFATIVWFKPPWATQIADGAHTFVVGRRTSTGTLATDSCLPYFVDEVLSFPTSTLLDRKRVNLIVITLTADAQPAAEADGSSRSNVAPAPPTPVLLDTVVAAVQAAGGGVCLDVCLDCFGALNPFRGDIAEPFFSFLGKVYANHSARSPAFRRCLDDCPTARADFLRQMEKSVIQGEGALVTDEAQLGGSCPAQPCSRVATLEQLALHLAELHAHAPAGTLVNPRRILDIGATTDLPHHTCSEAEHAGLLWEFRRWLDAIVAIQPPLIVTVARSAYDGYTPAETVETLQANVVQHIRAACGPAEVVLAVTVEDS